MPQSAVPAFPFYLANRPVAGNAELAVTDKFTGAVAARVVIPDRTAIESAVAAGRQAVEPMRRLVPHVRRRILEQAGESLRLRSDELARWVCVEAGKPLRDARTEVGRLLETFRIAAEESVRIGGEIMNLDLSERSAGTQGFTRRVPVGLCSFITPFNFPLNLVAHKIAPAIAAGCPFIVKPSERTPVSALLIGEALAATELPPGAFSILPARLEDAGLFVEDDRIELLSFTGSATVGWDLKRSAGRKRVTLELGGNAACIVDADQRERLDWVVERLVGGAFAQSGQSCISVQRILVHDSLYDDLRARFVSRAASLKAADPRDEATVIGPMIDERAAERLEGWVKGAQARGAKLLCGGARKGAMFDATVLEGVPSDEPLSREESFGPVAILQRFREFDEALLAVNESRYGLQTGVFTNDLAHALRAWEELEVGGVIIGDTSSFRVDSMPYGGVKDSGRGREGVRSAIAEMTEERLLVIKR